MTKFPSPPTFIPGMPSCQPAMSPRNGNSMDSPRSHELVEFLAGVVLDADSSAPRHFHRNGLRAVADHQILMTSTVGAGPVGNSISGFVVTGSP